MKTFLPNFALALVVLAALANAAGQKCGAQLCPDDKPFCIQETP